MFYLLFPQSWISWWKGLISAIPSPGIPRVEYLNLNQEYQHPLQSCVCLWTTYSNWAIKPDCIPSQTPVSSRSGLSSPLLTDKSASDSDLSSSDSWRYSAWCIQILCCVLFFSMVNKPVGGAWCNWNEPAVINHSWIRAKPREGGHLAARLTDSLCVSTEKLQTPSGYSTDSALKVRHKCSLYISARTTVYLNTVFRPASIIHGRHGSCRTNLRTSRHWSVFPVWESCWLCCVWSFHKDLHHRWEIKCDDGEAEQQNIEQTFTPSLGR